MIYTNSQKVIKAINSGDIKEGSTYTTTAGMFLITNIQTNGSDIIGESVELYIDADGNGEPHGNALPITAYDLVNAEF